jgi:glutamate--cysteine ligase
MNFNINSKQELENFVLNNWNKLNQYIDRESDNLAMPFYTSVDIRESKEKFAPVDTNIYPAGFNNLCQFDLNLASEKMKKYILNINESIKNIVIFPESHTKNRFYLDHLHTLKTCLIQSNFNVTIASSDTQLFEQDQNHITVESFSGHKLQVFKIDPEFINTKTINSVTGSIDLIVLNNDQSKQLDLNFSELNIPVIPSPKIGWYQRQKYKHFQYYREVVQNFCHEFNIDPRLLEAEFSFVEGIDFSSKTGLENIANEVKGLQEKVGPKKVFLKASQGTYGMGIHVVDSPEEVLNLNRKKRNKLDIGKNNIKFEKVLIQESVETIINYDGHPAEVTIYLVGGNSVGGFMRSNPLKDNNSNLNSKGMVYQKFCISEIHEGHDHQVKEAVYSFIARLASMACAKEIQEVSK